MAGSRARGAIAVLVAGAVACSRGEAPAAREAGPDPTRATSAAGPPADPDDAGARSIASPVASAQPATPPPSGEARRSKLARLEDEPELRPHLAALREHFGEGAKGPFLEQRIDLAEGRTAALVARADESDPFVLVFDRDQRLWTKPRPTAGIVAPAKHLTIAPRPDGGVVLFAWVASLHLVAARMWAEDGNAFGEFELFAPEACDTLSAAYAPAAGWVAACASRAGVRAQRMREDCTIAWGADGARVGAEGTGGAPVTIVFDSPSSIVLLGRAAAVGGEHLLAYRYDLDGQPLWPGPADLGMDLPSGAGAGRVVARLARDAVVRVERSAGVAGRAGARATEVTSSGEVRFL